MLALFYSRQTVYNPTRKMVKESLVRIRTGTAALLASSLLLNNVATTSKLCNCDVIPFSAPEWAQEALVMTVGLVTITRDHPLEKVLL